MQGIMQILCSIGKYVFLPLGAVLLAGAVYVFSDTRAWLARSVEASGSVIEIVRVRDRDTGGLSFAPVVRFATADGKAIEFQSSMQTSSPAYQTGQTVTVRYDPQKPNSAAIAGLFSIWGVPMILGFVGAVFLAVGVATVIFNKRVVDIATAPP